jgi:small-conductance mechanosensitive channel
MALLCSVALLLTAASVCAGAASEDERAHFSDSALIVRTERLIKAALEITGEDWPPERVNERIASLRQELEQLDAATADDTDGYRILVEWLLSVYEAYEKIIAPGASNIASDSPAAYETPTPPFSVRFYDDFRYESERTALRFSGSELLVKNGADQLEARITNYRRQQNTVNSIERRTGDGAGPEPERRFQRLLLELDMAQILIKAQDLKDAKEYSLRFSDVSKSNEKFLMYVRENLSFREDELASILDGVAAKIKERHAELSETTSLLEEAEKALAASSGLLGANIRLASGRQRRVEIYRTSGASAEAAEAALAVARFLVDNFKISSLFNEISLLTNHSALWRYRYDIMLGSADGETFWRARSEAMLAADSHKRYQDYTDRSLEDFQAMRTIIEDQIKTDEGRGGRRDAALMEIIALCDDIQLHTYSHMERTIKEGILLSGAIIEETTERTDSVRLAQKAERTISDLRDMFMGQILWRGDGFELTAYDLTVALIIIIVGFFVSSLTAWITARILEEKLSRDKAFAKSVTRICFYFLWAIFIIAALHSVNVPLTAFAFLGGIVALAVGFGAQDLCRNLISGLIILFNRPFKRDDIVEVDGLRGTVNDIGPRSTSIFTSDGIDISVPNSHFIDNKVVNRTRSGLYTRKNFTILVSSAEDPGEVEAILQEIIKDYRNDQKNKEPFVALVDIYKDVFRYRIYYWMNDRYSSDLISGRIRHEIAAHFKERGIELYQPAFNANFTAN